jgi:hypothetical protein
VFPFNPTRGYSPNPVLEIVLEIVVVALAIVVYFMPAFVAFNMHKPRRVPILVLNILLGWTFIGWMVLFVWAFEDH